MKKKRILIIISSSLVIILSVITYFNHRLNNEWIKKDEKMIEEILPILYEMPYLYDLLTNYSFNNEKYFTTQKKELGLGYSKTSFTRYGRYTNVYVNILTDKNNNSINCIINITSNKRVMKIFDKNYNLTNIQGSSIFYYAKDARIVIQHRNTNLYENYISDFHNYFQIYNNIYIPDEIKTEYEILLNAKTYAYRIGYDGEIIPSEREALEKILEKKNKNLLFAIIASPNPEARIYAIEGLFKNRINDIISENEYEDIIDKTVTLNCRIMIGWADVNDSIYIYSRNDLYNLINFIVK